MGEAVGLAHRVLRVFWLRLVRCGSALAFCAFVRFRVWLRRVCLFGACVFACV